MKVRREVSWFSGRVEKKLRVNDFKGGWRREQPIRLYQKLQNELYELYRSFGVGTNGEIIDECADVAAFAMMIADNVHRRRNGKVP